MLQTTETTHDEFSRETQRTISATKSGKVLTIASTYDNENKVVGCVTTAKDTSASASLTESFTYDSKRRLETYDASKHTTDSLLPHNENGNAFTKQSFEFNSLDNITSTFPNGDSDSATFSYDTKNHMMLKKISHSCLPT